MPTNLASPSVAEAAARRGRGPSSSSVVGRLASSDSIDVGGFTPGTMLAERYRVIGLIGRGGMGEVYRADDLKLGQPVALKFLPERFSSDKAFLDRLFAEVRTARQVSHPNVCRVYDVGETDGRHFLSMEYVDGEDLASLLRRIGGLPQPKALEIARQLCAGLSAAHERNVLHRDLKPANVMVDGRGRARIMDFGLAVAAGEADAGMEIAGTPAYMAPELFAGKGASVRSDLYALGLVLFELYTGRHAFDAPSLAGYRQKHVEETPSSPSALVPGLDPAVERAILRCVEKDPKMRPASAAQVAAALPGGDPLAAAIAAGETPSPEMVAAAGSEDRLSPAVAGGLVAATVAVMLLHAFLAPRISILPLAGSEKSGEVLRVRAREVLAGLGMPERPADWAGNLAPDVGFLEWVAGHDSSSERWHHGISRDALSYLYRESPLPLVPENFTGGPFPSPLVTELDPAPVRTGMKEVVLDPEGRLKELHVVPPQIEKPSASAPAGPDWAPLFRAAGLDSSLFRPAEPQWSPRAHADVRAAWEGPHPERPGLTMRVEAAAWRGRPVSFLWIGPWSRSSRDVPGQRSAAAYVGDVVWLLILLTLLFAGAWMARRNLRAGRGDRRGAMRLAAAVFVLQLSMWAFGAHHVSTLEEFDIFAIGLSDAAMLGVYFWVVYIALEPFMRRHWPRMLISWTRLLAGGWRDPLVGRDLLVGASAGALIGILMGPIRRYIPGWIGEPPPIPRGIAGDPSSVRGGLAWLIQAPAISIVWVLGLVMFLVLVRRVVRQEWIAGIIVALFFSANYLAIPPLHVTLPLAAATTGLLVVIAIRFGLLAALVCQTCNLWLGSWVMTPDPSAWYFYVGAIAIGLVLALALWGLRTTTQGAPSPA
ncbi:MAG: serine/threonine protein kinase [Acidobacteriota bacterium]|nr:serine/threonine protein kinase [Acidobacteriota bacterium]